MLASDMDQPRPGRGQTCRCPVSVVGPDSNAVQIRKAGGGLGRTSEEGEDRARELAMARPSVQRRNHQRSRPRSLPGCPRPDGGGPRVSECRSRRTPSACAHPPDQTSTADHRLGCETRSVSQMSPRLGGTPGDSKPEQGNGLTAGIRGSRSPSPVRKCTGTGSTPAASTNPPNRSA